MHRFDNSFWSALDALVSKSEIIIDRPKGTAHPKYPDFIYKVNYGYLKDTASMDGAGIDVWVGTNGKNIDAIIADCMPKASIDMKQSGNRGIAEAVISAISLQNDRVAAVCTDMLNVMSRYLPDIANMKVVTDTGVLIGELAPGLDVVFGELTEEKYRGVG